jgi:DNA ligase-1
MTINELAAYLARLESTPSRNEMTEILADLLNKADAGEIDKICYLILGRLAPLYAGVEFNLADKMMIRVLAKAADKDTKTVLADYKKLGDLGKVASRYRRKKKAEKSLAVSEVFDWLAGVAADAGEGSQERKINTLADLVSRLDYLAAKYVVRIVLGKLRLGFSDVTLLDALSWSEAGDKSLRKKIEAVYNIYPDIGRAAAVFKSQGLPGLERIKVTPGVPIRPALAERLPSVEKVLEKLGEVAVEPKMDGVRMQCHLDSSKSLEKNERASYQVFDTAGAFVRLFSRNLEETTVMFPDVVEALQDLAEKKGLRSVIFDSEAIAYNPETGEFLPFQETARRKRKYGVEKKAQEMPLKVFLFDVLYLNGEDLLERPFRERREMLEKTVGEGNEVFQVVRQEVGKTAAKLRRLFDLYIAEGLEGMMCKKLESEYQAGGRNYNWVKLKRAQKKGGLADTLDVVVLGYYRGAGKRSAFGIGAFLVGVYDDEKGVFPTIAKIGTGLTDEQWREMRRRGDEIAVEKPDRRYVFDKQLACDVWVAPEIVVEVQADEITRSPIHTAGQGVKLEGEGRSKDGASGLALRFPRLVRFRDDKSFQQATTLTEILELYRMQ